ncbi:8-amino-7-oxononanoate synthase [Vibrio ichthyoenteri ATCC 700023]|uniref:8-amino-7-oxononanoate synthase n=1 Tax=Vibrio ichthyoenteri ATCC 700023 TaxID=870968 RepID=F9S6V8_9VIBR|nr:8-amino-7-oxononanoate synthase [Vibrio ichthyoenteri]EGU32239.1 8-amino-7-oxononanoate synthase [Vibrio ichthyoenteri ATCC 700023]
MKLTFDQRIKQALAERQTQGLQRQLMQLDNANSVSLYQQRQHYLNFSSNDYLGLARDGSLAEAWKKGIDLLGNGSGSSPLVTGFSHAHQALEHRLCEWLGYSRAILFGSGFSANQAMIFALMQKGDLLLQDKLNHASLIEAGMLSAATMKRFKHNDIEHLENLLEGHPLVVTEGVFSMDGDLAPLPAIANITQDNAWLAVDDAHGIGVLGQGRGSCHQAGIKPQLQVVTFGKAFGLSGAAILCDEQTGDYLTQFARHHVYSTAIPPSLAYALTHAIDMIDAQQWRRDKLQQLQACYDELCGQLPGYVETQTPIKPLLIASSERALSVATKLREKGFWLTAIRPPTVPVDGARLRITLTAAHTLEQVTQLSAALKVALEV